MIRIKLLTLLFVFIPVGLYAADTIGSIKTVGGKVSVIRAEGVIPATAGSKVFKNDALETGDDGAVGVILRDDTRVSLGPKSKIVFDDFVFSPREQKYALVTRMSKGTATCVTGMIGKLSPKSVRFETPLATLGIRGTKFAVQIEE
ncbi:MAG: FecR domain-containing protein [Candidatus Magnetobacterium sp. LHC-1]|uniref:FecR domain-containing protein n=1 Tax=Candidatus Magnetobacterium casense TaxID=1455061 RepID=A0ABS6RVU1_9BACT|nr:FecR domain-containing protein [Candidatus Magnetobacterium casensis]MBF0609083.1 FecR domain-containing protein [Nitrospirota bacterium]MBV6340465.1 FecR domain-containing protein [Candidatus Magnetobacterium casensis]